MESLLDIRVSIPPTDARFLKQLAAKMGWRTETKESFMRKYAASRPKNVNLSDKDITEELYAVRYGK